MLSRNSKDWLIEQGQHQQCYRCDGFGMFGHDSERPEKCSRCGGQGIIKIPPQGKWAIFNDDGFFKGAPTKY